LSQRQSLIIIDMSSDYKLYVTTTAARDFCGRNSNEYIGANNVIH